MFVNNILNPLYYMRKRVEHISNENIHYNNNGAPYLIIILCLFIMMLVIGTVSLHVTAFSYIFVMVSAIMIIYGYLFALQSAVTSARKLVTVLFINIFLAALIGAMLIHMIPKLGNPLISWIVIMTVYFVLWFTFCLLIDLKTSKLVNEVISGLLSVITAFLNVALLSLPYNYHFTCMTSQFIVELNKHGYSTVQFMQVLVNVLLFPLLLCSGMTIIGIDIYTYWENKYK